MGYLLFWVSVLTDTQRLTATPIVSLGLVPIPGLEDIPWLWDGTSSECDCCSGEGVIIPVSLLDHTVTREDKGLSGGGVSMNESEGGVGTVDSTLGDFRIGEVWDHSGGWEVSPAGYPWGCSGNYLSYGLGTENLSHVDTCGSGSGKYYHSKSEKNGGDDCFHWTPFKLSGPFTPLGG